MQGVIIGCLALLTIGMVTWRKPRVIETRFAFRPPSRGKRMAG